MLAVATLTEAETPRDLTDLNAGERLLVWSLRTMAVGHGDCPLMEQTFGRLCGPMGPAVLQAHFILMKLIGMTSRRPLRVHAPGCICIGADETAVVGVVAAAQAALTGDDGLLRLRLAFLARSESGETLRCAALALARVLSLGGQMLPMRMEQRLTADEEPGALRSVH